jgi:hypothetical protein
MLTETLIRTPIVVIGRSSSMSASHWLQGKCDKFSYLKQLQVLFYKIVGCFLYAFKGQSSLLYVSVVGN